jgi:putative hydrolase of the HAD superfamily
MVENIRHFSFDLWMTIIKSNPIFKKERALYFFKNFNSLKKSIEEVELVFRNIDLMMNAINEKTGKNLDADEMYLMAVFNLNGSLSPFENINGETIYNELEKLIFEYNPVAFSTETYSILDKIKQNKCTINILSNTGFIKGSTLRKVLDNLELSKYFDFQIYSDEVGMSKPDARMYQYLLENIYSIPKNKNILLNQVLHVGDNAIADIKGAQLAGINAFQINTNNKLITHLFNNGQ